MDFMLITIGAAAVVYVAGLVWVWYSDRSKAAAIRGTENREISDMTEAELVEGMERLGNQYRAMADVIRARRSRTHRQGDVQEWLKHEGYEGFMSRTVVRKLIDDDDPWDNAQVGH